MTMRRACWKNLMESYADQHASLVDLWDEMTMSRACWKNIMEGCCDQQSEPVELWDEMTASTACWKNCDRRISSQWSCCDHRILMERCPSLPGPWRMVVNEDCGRDLFERNNTYAGALLFRQQTATSCRKHWTDPPCDDDNFNRSISVHIFSH